MRRLQVAAALALAGFLGLQGCHQTVQGIPHHLELRATPASPASLLPGTLVSVVAVVVPPVDLDGVSGTVAVLGARTVPFKKDPTDGLYKFKTMIPPMVDIPSGTYKIKAWGRSAAGEDVQGELDYKVR